MPPVGTTGGASGTTTTPTTTAGTSATAGTGMMTGTTAGSGTAGGAATGSQAGRSGATAGMSAPVAGTGTAGAMAGVGGATSGTGGSSGTTGGAGGEDASAGAGGGAPVANNCLMGDGDFSKAGPYRVSTKELTIGSSGPFTLYIPEPLADNCHPVVAWGNGTTVPGGTAYRHFNERMATWGLVVAASHNDGQGSGARIGDGSFHKAAIDHLLAENMKMGSQFFGKLNGKAGVTGHSQGGAGGDRASNHPAVKANANVQGSFGAAPANVAFLCLTGTEDIAVEGCRTAVNGTKSPAMYANYDGLSHTATLSARAPGTVQYARLMPAWFRCFLADDAKACEMFKGGEMCPVCQEDGWEQIFSKNY